MKKTKLSRKTCSETKKLIIKTARQLFSKYSYLSVSMEDIAQRLHITKAALYHHFASKAEIYKTVLRDLLGDLKVSLKEAFKEKTADKKLQKAVENYLAFGLKERGLVKALATELLQENRAIKKYLLQFKKEISKLIEPLIKELASGRKVNLNHLPSASFLLGTLNGILIEQLISNKKADLKKLSKRILYSLGLGLKS